MRPFRLLLSSLALSLLLAAGPLAAMGQDTTASPPPDPEAYSGELQNVKAVVDAFGRMWEEEDLETFDRIIARDDDMVVIGTDSAEFVVGYEAFREARQAQYEAFENVDFNVQQQDIKLSESGTVAWFSETFDLFTVASGKQVNLDGLRVTGVLEKRDGQWKIVQLHTSVPVPGQAAEY
jgi:uncharacterized protein (TIGR02246 family)